MVTGLLRSQLTTRDRASCVESSSGNPAVHRRWGQWLGGPILGLSLVLAGGFWCGQAILNPPAAMAYTSRLDLFITRQPEESFEALVRRSEIIARAAVQRSFDADVLITEVKVTIVADSQGVSVPILTVEVGRNDWRALPDVEKWANYYSAAQGLMGM